MPKGFGMDLTDFSDLASKTTEIACTSTVDIPLIQINFLKA
jgi:hypothetical protein